MNVFLAASEAAFDLLDSAEVLHTFDDSVTLCVDRELWEAFLNQGA
jgi:hypothetical protein